MKVLAIVGVLLLAAPAQALLTVLAPTVDAFATSNDNFNTDVVPILGSSTLSVALSGAGEERATLHFNPSALPPAGEQIISASLILYMIQSDANIGVHAITGDGAITASDFTFTGPVTTFAPSSGNPAVINTVNVTSFFTNPANLGMPVIFQLRELNDGEFNSIISATNLQTRFHPRLEIVTAPVAVPEPASALLGALGVGGIGALLLRRWRHAPTGTFTAVA